MKLISGIMLEAQVISLNNFILFKIFDTMKYAIYRNQAVSGSPSLIWFIFTQNRNEGSEEADKKSDLTSRCHNSLINDHIFIK